MPATEQTWRDLGRTHVVFGLSSLAMLATSIWLFAVDHNREWKQYQRDFRNVQAWTTEARLAEQQTADFARTGETLEKELREAQAALFDGKLIERFLAEAETHPENRYKTRAVEQASQRLVEAHTEGASVDEVIALRRSLGSALQAVIEKAKFAEESVQRRLKFRRADRDVMLSSYAIAVDEGKSAEELDIIQRGKDGKGGIDGITVEINQLDLDYQDARSHRVALQTIVGELEKEEADVAKALEEHRASTRRLKDALAEQRLTWYENILTLPIIDAFGRPLKIEQIWLPELTLNNNFRDVARFDRCTTCHQGIDRTAPGSSVEPAYAAAEQLELRLATPKAAPELEAGLSADERLREIYGMQLAERGMLQAGDVTVQAVWPLTAAAEAGLQAGDVIQQINDVKVLTRPLALDYLVQTVEWGKPLVLSVRRGTPQPFSSHPRLDLYVGSMSPHKMGEFGCTICHEGQGSATEFKWASHTPNTPGEMRRWTREHGWFNNHHWIFPMRPERFVESSCLKCHHEMTELEPSDRFPDPPAPKLTAGYDIVRTYGCFGCHEISGYDSPERRRGPDVRAEPGYYAAAAQVLADPALGGEQLSDSLRQIAALAHEVVKHPEKQQARRRLAELIRADQEAAKGGAAGAHLSAASEALGAMLGADDETPGQHRKVGPSLRHLASKVDLPFLYSWIKEPKSFRPSTRMPQFFGLWDHLEKVDEHGRPVILEHAGEAAADTKGLADARKFEPVEILAASAYLLAASQPYDYAKVPRGVNVPASAERGKQLFETRGCLACHKHADFPEAQNRQGPDLSRLGAKLVGEKGADWLYSWLREPDRYHSRTLMPNLLLEPIAEAEGNVTDPADDIAAYLLASTGWQPEAVPELDGAALDELALMYLRGAFTQRESERYLSEGIPEEMAGSLKGDELELVGRITEQKKLLYVGRKTIGRLGCAGCHDMPGFEEAKPIGTGLADWGRKETSKLAFEQILKYLEEKESHLEGGGGHGHGLNTKDMPADKGYFVQALLNHEREGFLWQKLREPRSYDYKKTENKPYTDRLRMPKFALDDQQVEQVMTFVLGLVSEPPRAQYVYKPSPERAAVLKGQRLLEKYNCTACHTMKQDVWKFEYRPYDPDNPDQPGMLLPPPPFDDYEFLRPHFTPEQLAASKMVDRRGMGTAEVMGVPNPEVAEDDEGDPLYFFAPWAPAAIDGQVWAVGGTDIPVGERQWLKDQSRPPVGGEFARLLHPVALALELKNNPNAKGSDAWGFVPPPLLGEGEKVQTQWLHDFLLDPYPIRPSVILRMPRFNMSSEEASDLANYFAAVDGAPYPYEFDRRTRRDYLAAMESGHPGRLQDALKIVVDNNYCIKCHLLGDFVPPGSAAALAPNLDRVHQRLRPDFLQKWLANPKRLLPYTGMPVNFPRDKPADQNLFRGSSEEQLQAIVDLLLNWDEFMKGQTSIKPLVKPVPPPEAAGQAAGAERAPQAGR